MALAPATRLGPYEIVALVGAGGMGEVYRARDTTLGRTVAIKVVSTALGDSLGDGRLEREARALAALNHPHIATLYGVEPFGNTRALVMEFVEGVITNSPGRGVAAPDGASGCRKLPIAAVCNLRQPR